jgi:hypothetical protein
MKTWKSCELLELADDGQRCVDERRQQMSVKWEVEESTALARQTSSGKRVGLGMEATYLVSHWSRDRSLDFSIACDIIEPRYLATRISNSLARDALFN